MREPAVSTCSSSVSRKVMGDIAEGALSVILFAVITLVLTLLAVWLYCQSFRIALIPVMCSVIAVVWQLGGLVVLGFGIDPLGLLVPFLIFAIGVSHGVQKISAVKEAAFFGIDSMQAARRTLPSVAGAGGCRVAGGSRRVHHDSADPCTGDS